MATILTLYRGRLCLGRCDATCYNAKGTRCTCVCGGMNHGVGYEAAMRNNHRDLTPILKRHEPYYPNAGPLDLRTNNGPIHPLLFSTTPQPTPQQTGAK